MRAPTLTGPQLRRSDLGAFVLESSSLSRRPLRFSDRDRTFTPGDWWGSAAGYDWEDKEKGQCSDAYRGITVGRGVYGAHEDGEQHQFVLIKFIDTHEMRKEGRWGNAPQPAIWGMALTAKEFRTLSEKIVEGGEEAELIHREPPFEDASWYCEARWWVDSGKVVGIRIAAKMTQDKVPTVKAIKFITAGAQFRVAGEEVDETNDPNADADWEKVVKAHQPPPPHYDGPPPMVFAQEKEAIKEDYEAEGESALEIAFSDPKSVAETARGWNEKNFNQIMTSGTMTLTNPTDNDIAVKEVYAEYKHASTNGEWVRCARDPTNTRTKQNTYVGQKVVGWRGSTSIEFMENGTSFPLKAHTPAEVVIRGFIMKEGAKAYNGRPLCMRIHAAWGPGPMTMRATFVDDTDATKSICWDHSNPPLRYRDFSNYAEMIALKKENDVTEPRYKGTDGVGEDFVCDLWQHVDNPADLSRVYCVVTSAKEGGDKWYIRCTKVNDDFPRSVTYIRPTAFKRLVYDAKKTGESEVDVSSKWGSACKNLVKLTALIDLEAECVWGLRCVITHGGVTASNSMIFDHARVKASKK